MHDEIVRILSPLLVVAAMAATQAAQPMSHNSLAASDWQQRSVASSCHGTRLGNSRGSTCPVAPRSPENAITAS